MRSLRSTALALALLLAGPAMALAAPRPTAAAKRAPARSPIERPFKAGLAALPTTAIIKIMGNDHLEARQYREISAATRALLTKYPPETHYFVGLGRDPAPIIAFLQNLGGKDLAVNFPASSNESSRATVKRLERYVDKIIPKKILKSGRTIVFVDATSSGRALDRYVPLIAPNLKGAKAIKVAYDVGGSIRRSGSRGDKRLISTTAFPEVDRFYFAPYEGVVSEFPRHGPGTHRFSVLDNPRPQYQQFRDALMERMKRDKTLDNFLAARSTR